MREGEEAVAAAAGLVYVPPGVVPLRCFPPGDRPRRGLGLSSGCSGAGWPEKVLPRFGKWGIVSCRGTSAHPLREG